MALYDLIQYERNQNLTGPRPYHRTHGSARGGKERSGRNSGREHEREFWFFSPKAFWNAPRELVGSVIPYQNRVFTYFDKVTRFP